MAAQVTEGGRDVGDGKPTQETDGAVAQRGHHLGRAATADQGLIFAEVAVANPVATTVRPVKVPGSNR